MKFLGNGDTSRKSSIHYGDVQDSTSTFKQPALLLPAENDLFGRGLHICASLLLLSLFPSIISIS